MAGAKRKRAAPKAGAKDVDKVTALFNSYRDESDASDTIGPEGVERLCSDLKLEPSDRKVLLLAWKMGAKKMGFFSREEFTSGCMQLGANSVAQLRSSLPSLEAAVREPATFSEFYAYAFQFCLTEPGQRIVDVETAATMLALAAPGARFVPSLCAYLREQRDYKVVNADQWAAFLRFSREVAPDMTNAGDNPAWPVLLDGFVDWWRQSNS